MRNPRSFALLLTALLLTAAPPPAQASSDNHKRLPPVPNGYAAIVRTFGQPCSADATRNAGHWIARDDGVHYPIKYHALLGGPYSTALHDVVYHLTGTGLLSEMRSGIYAYACRRKSGNDSEWSTHAFGIAFDVSARYEHFRHSHCHVISEEAGRIWTGHRWRWGIAFDDCMHFQWATGY